MLTLYEIYKVDPTYLITGEKRQEMNIELYLTNCERVERDRLIERMLSYMKQLMLKP